MRSQLGEYCTDCITQQIQHGLSAKECKVDTAMGALKVRHLQWLRDRGYSNTPA